MLVRLRAVVPCLLALAATGLTVAPAQATTYTSTGRTCTVVGTAGADRLVGTGARDVICGLGGADTIDARGGDDLVDAGSGADRVHGGAGADRLLGTAGRDTLAGDGGADTVVGGADGDTLTGGDGGDDLVGGDGNDDLVGGPAADDLEGGAGTDWCTVGSQDTQTSCVYDREPASSDSGHLSDDRVDVSDATRVVTARAHVLDDTGATRVSLSVNDDNDNTSASGDADLVSGTIRDGVWEAEIPVLRWSAPGDLTLAVSMRDRVGRWSGRSFPQQVLTVVDRNPDTEQPAASLLSPGPSASYDVRTSGQDVVVKARLTDAVSGVAWANVCLWKPFDGGFANLACPRAELVDGDRYDGTWRAVVHVDKGETGGDWNVEVAPTDRAHANSEPKHYLGPDAYRYFTNDGSWTDPSYAELPDGKGRFTVLGTDDSHPPVVKDDVVVSPDHVDTLTAGATVSFTVHATDVEGVSGVGVYLHAGTTDGTAPEFVTVDLVRTGGTAKDGTWTGSLDLPGGTPPGSYYLQVFAQDASHFRSWVSAGSPYAGDPNQKILTADPKVVVVDSSAG